MEVQVLLLVVLAVVGTVRVNGNATIASAATHEMIEDPGAATESWARVGKEATEWGKEKIEEGLGLKHSNTSQSRNGNDNGEHISNIDRETNNDGSKNFQAANEAARKAKEWGDIAQEGSKKMSEITRLVKEKAYNTSEEAAHKATSMKDVVIDKGQEVKGKIQENAGETSKKVKDKAKHEAEIAAQKAKKTKDNIAQKAHDAKDNIAQKSEDAWETMSPKDKDAQELTNNKRRKVTEKQRVVEEWKEL